MLRRLILNILLSGASLIGVAVMSTIPVGAMVGQWAPGSLAVMSNYNNHTCALADGGVFCWGRNNYGQLGIGITDTNTHVLPEKVVSALLNGKNITKLVIGGTGFACVVADGWPYCWGRNTYGQLGTGNSTSYSSPVAVVDSNNVLSGKTVTDIAAGDGHVCVVASGKPYCWGG